jgi:protoporphyrinogen oxidase
MTTKHYDIIIVGAGLAGLYSAYNIKKMSPETSLLVLESNRRPYIGGRIGNHIFYGTNVVVGAGVGRKDTDKLWLKLLKELNIKTKSFPVSMHYSKNIKNPIDIKEYLNQLRTTYHSYKNPPSVTFKKFATEHLGPKLYKDFIISSGYSDYENEDAYEVLYHYQMEDNAPGWTALDISWSTVVNMLCNKIGNQNILASTKVEKIDKIDHNPCLFELTTTGKQNTNKVYYSNKVIIATRISTVQKLLPQFKIYKEIHGQPFLYIYAKFNKESSEIMSQLVSTYTIVAGPLQKMIPFSDSVYMIAYADNKNAELLQKYKENTPENRHFFEKEVEEALGIIPNTLKIIAIKDFYWPIGTHYYEPLDLTKYNNRPEFIREAQHPEPGMLVVGEAVSRRQGWSEGALESVENVLTKSWINTYNC